MSKPRYLEVPGRFVGIAVEQLVKQNKRKKAPFGDVINIWIRFALDYFYSEAKGEWVPIHDQGLVVDGLYPVVFDTTGIHTTNMRALVRTFDWDGDLTTVADGKWYEQADKDGKVGPRTVIVDVDSYEDKRFGNRRCFVRTFSPRGVELPARKRRALPDTEIGEWQKVYGRSLGEVARRYSAQKGRKEQTFE